MAQLDVPNAISFKFCEEIPFLRNSTRVGQTDGRADQRTDEPRDGRTEGQTHPLIEMRERI